MGTFGGGPRYDGWQLMDDEFLVRQILGGNRDAFRLLVLRYERPLFRFLGLLGFAQDAAEDVAQQTFLRVFRALPSFDARQSKFGTWLFTIAKRLAANERQRAHHRYEQPVADASDDGDVPVTTPADPAVSAERTRRLRDAIAALPEALRSTFFLSQINELTLDEVAAVEGCALGTVKSRIHRARQQLRAALAEEEA
jgi:RNA polymerase sigma-70 factor (ECF subfamily)